MIITVWLRRLLLGVDCHAGACDVNISKTKYIQHKYKFISQYHSQTCYTFKCCWPSAINIPELTLAFQQLQYCQKKFCLQLLPQQISIRANRLLYGSLFTPHNENINCSFLSHNSYIISHNLHNFELTSKFRLFLIWTFYLSELQVYNTILM